MSRMKREIGEERYNQMFFRLLNELVADGSVIQKNRSINASIHDQDDLDFFMNLVLRYHHDQNNSVMLNEHGKKLCEMVVNAIKPRLREMITDPDILVSIMKKLDRGKQVEVVNILNGLFERIFLDKSEMKKNEIDSYFTVVDVLKKAFNQAYPSNQDNLIKVLDQIIEKMGNQSWGAGWKERWTSGVGSKKLDALTRIRDYLRSCESLESEELKNAEEIVMRVCAYKRNPCDLRDTHSLTEYKTLYTKGEGIEVSACTAEDLEDILKMRSDVELKNFLRNRDPEMDLGLL